jgi:Mg2+ and Co2+ transporter CorA
MISDRIAEFSESDAFGSGSKGGQSETMDAFLKNQNRLLQKGRILEQHIRDTIQVNIGNLSLQESRRSIQQADSIGRISFLGFLFSPFSLVMSFFGMNIQQLTGSGASWRTFLISAAALCALMIIVSAWLWRKSKRVRFSLTQLLCQRF